LDDVAVGNDVALGIHQDARTQRALAARTGSATTRTALPAKEAIEEVVKRTASSTLIVISGASRQPAPVRVLDGGLGVDVHHARLELFGDLRKLVGKLLRRGYGQRRCVGTLFVFLAFDVV